MAAVNQQPVSPDTGDFAARVQAAQQALADGIAKAGLQHDPYRHPLEALAMMVGLFPELIRHLEATRQPVRDEDLRKAVMRGVAAYAGETVRMLNVRNTLTGIALGIGLLLAGSVGGYLFHGAVPMLAGVRAGAEQCQDKPNGGRMCWIPVWERLPPR